MSFESLLSDLIDIYRLAQQNNGIVTSYGTEPYNEGVPCLIQPITAEFAAKTDYVFGRSYNCFVPIDTDIKISDRVIDEFGKTYQVNATLNRPYGAAVPHLTVLLTEEPTGDNLV